MCYSGVSLQRYLDLNMTSLVTEQFRSFVRLPGRFRTDKKKIFKQDIGLRFGARARPVARSLGPATFF